MNDFTKNELQEKPPIEINFPLNDLDIIRLLKGVEYTQQVYLHPKQMVRIKVFSSDRMKHISWNDWRQIVHASYSSPHLMDVIRRIENE